MGGGTFHSRQEPELLGFTEDTPHYKALFSSYCTQMQEHLRQKGWLNEAFVYWFDEPDPKDYPFVSNGFAKLKAAAPDLNRMLTEKVEPGADRRAEHLVPHLQQLPAREPPSRDGSAARNSGGTSARDRRPPTARCSSTTPGPSCGSGSGRRGNARSKACSSGRRTTGPARRPIPTAGIRRTPTRTRWAGSPATARPTARNAPGATAMDALSIRPSRRPTPIRISRSWKARWTASAGRCSGTGSKITSTSRS